MWKRHVSGIAFDVRTLNPYRFSSEYADDALGLVYYNYRHYNPLDGRWCGRDRLSEALREITSAYGGKLRQWHGCLYVFADNSPINVIDYIGNDAKIIVWHGSPGHMALKCDDVYISKYPDWRSSGEFGHILGGSKPFWFSEDDDARRKGSKTEIPLRCLDCSKAKAWFKNAQSNSRYQAFTDNCMNAVVAAIEASVVDQQVDVNCQCCFWATLLGFYKEEYDLLDVKCALPVMMIENLRDFASNCQRKRCVLKHRMDH